jgi:hypothetical protein
LSTGNRIAFIGEWTVAATDALLGRVATERSGENSLAVFLRSAIDIVVFLCVQECADHPLSDRLWITNDPQDGQIIEDASERVMNTRRVLGQFRVGNVLPKAGSPRNGEWEAGAREKHDHSDPTRR